MANWKPATRCSERPRHGKCNWIADLTWVQSAISRALVDLLRGLLDG